MILISILLVFALLGLIDKLFNGRFGLAPAFDQGLAAMGPLSVSIAGIYCGAIRLMDRSGTLIAALQQLPFDASVLIGSLLAPDLGGWPMAETLAQSPAMGLFSGLLVASTLGGLISFALPVSFGLLEKQERSTFVEGILWGIATLPLGLLPGGILLGMDAGSLLRGLLPLLIFCSLLITGLHFFPKGLLHVLTLFGNLVRLLGMVLFGVLVFGLFFPDYAVFSEALAGEAFQLIIRTTAVVCGSLVLSHLTLKYLSRSFARLADRLQINLPSVMGLVLTLVSCISMLPLYDQMDRRGKKANAAFVVGSAFCLGGQMAYVATVANSHALAAYLVCKLVCGVLAVICCLHQKRR